MKARSLFAKAIAKLAVKNAKIACGAASFYASYQPKEPANLKDLIK